MFKFLKEKLKGALDLFAKKDQPSQIDQPVDDNKSAQSVEFQDEAHTTSPSEIQSTPSKSELAQDVSKQKKTDADKHASQQVSKLTSEKISESTDKKEKTEPVQKQEKPKPVVVKEPVDKKEKANKIEKIQTIEKIPKSEAVSEVVQPTPPKVSKSIVEQQAKQQLATSQPATSSSQSSQSLQSSPVSLSTQLTSEKKSVQPTPVAPEPKKGFFSQLTQTLTKTTISREEFEELFFSLEISLLESNVAVQVIDKLKDDLSQVLVQKPIARGKVSQTVNQILAHTLSQVLDDASIPISRDLFVSQQGVFIIAVVGVNGAGKTTTIAKLAKKLQSMNLSVVCGACDTFRAAAIEQLQTHATNVGVHVISQQYGADPTAVAFDTVQYAQSHKIDVVLLDTAGRLHSNDNLMAQLTKLKRVIKPNMTLFVGEALTGNDCVTQAQEYDQRVGIDAIILTKADVDQKGGTALSISYVTKKPILFLGFGQGYDDLRPFDAQQLKEQLLDDSKGE
jgi:fused signal recognition particle receptor